MLENLNTLNSKTLLFLREEIAAISVAFRFETVWVTAQIQNRIALLQNTEIIRKM